LYERYWNFKHKPFENTPDPKFLFFSSQHQEALFKLQYAVEEGKGAAVLTGEYGCGKTLLTRVLVKNLDESRYDIGLLTNPRWKAEELLKELLYQLGYEVDMADKSKLLHKLNDEVLFKNFQEGRSTVIIIDEAQMITDFETLEELRLLLNFQLDDKFLLTLILSGQPELNPIIDSIPQFEQRIAVRHHLTGFSLEETEEYVKYRLAVAGREDPTFTAEAVYRVFELTQGTPRKINNLCDICLLIGFTRKASLIDVGIVDGANGARTVRR
jgi:type II secretory pathway predicted ATPase ExeA